MNDVVCPYCKESQEINHDDGYGYTEDVMHEQHCTSCGELFKFETIFTIHYEVFCNGDHDMELSPIKGNKIFYQCNNCDHSEIRREKL